MLCKNLTNEIINQLVFSHSYLNARFSQRSNSRKFSSSLVYLAITFNFIYIYIYVQGGERPETTVQRRDKFIYILSKNVKHKEIRCAIFHFQLPFHMIFKRHVIVKFVYNNRPTKHRRRRGCQLT